jgi:hypothetical protein
VFAIAATPFPKQRAEKLNIFSGVSSALCAEIERIQCNLFIDDQAIGQQEVLLCEP